MTGCGCHDPAVFGHLDCDLAPAWARTLLAIRHCGEGENCALNRRLAELRGSRQLPIPYAPHINCGPHCPYSAFSPD